jgi:hypothetical protein
MLDDSSLEQYFYQISWKLVNLFRRWKGVGADNMVVSESYLFLFSGEIKAKKWLG